jgi:hypothetical protein
MDSSTHAISPLRQRMIDDMRMRKLNPKTQSAYIRAVRQFALLLVAALYAAPEKPQGEREAYARAEDGARAARSELARTQTRRHPGIGAVGPVGTVPKRRDAEDGQTLQR